MKLAEIVKSEVFRAKNPAENFQKWQDGFKQDFKYCQISSIRKYYSSVENRTITYIFYFPFNGYINGFGNKGLCSCDSVNEFKRKFKKLTFNK